MKKIFHLFLFLYVMNIFASDDITPSPDFMLDFIKECQGRTPKSPAARIGFGCLHFLSAYRKELQRSESKNQQKLTQQFNKKQRIWRSKLPSQLPLSIPKAHIPRIITDLISPIKIEHLSDLLLVTDKTDNSTPRITSEQTMHLIYRPEEYTTLNTDHTKITISADQAIRFSDDTRLCNDPTIHALPENLHLSFNRPLLVTSTMKWRGKKLILHEQYPKGLC